MWWYLRSKFFETLEQRRVSRQFYSNERFKQLDQALLRAYQHETAYAVSKNFLISKGAPDPYLYGETPLSTLYRLARHFEIGPTDCLFELGAGRCRGSFFLAEVIGCRVVAIEQIPQFISLAKQLNSPKVTLLNEDFFTADLSAATAIYLYGSHLKNEEIVRLSTTFLSLSPEVKILTVSYPLEDFHSGFRISGQLKSHFPWGKTTIFCNRRITP